jgi:uncharacterized protein YbjT (DUF2867 family)
VRITHFALTFGPVSLPPSPTQNFSEGPSLDQVRSGEVALPAESVREPFVDVDDLAEVAAAALTEDRHRGEVYELTGPRLLTFAEAIEEIARAAGREIRYVRISVEEYASMLALLEIPADYVALVVDLFTEVLDGRNARLTDGVERALGRAPRDRGLRASGSSGRRVAVVNVPCLCKQSS